MKTIAFPVLLLTFILLMSPGYSQEPGDSDYPEFTGIWDTGMGRLALWQARDAVWGYYEGNGEIGGHIKEDGVYHFYYEVASGDMGMGWLELTDDGLGFEGFYASTLETDTNGTWEGTFVAPNSFEIGDRNALNYQPIEPVTETETPDTQPVAGDPGEEPDDGSDEEPFDDAGEIVVDPDLLAIWTGTWDTQRGYLVLTVGSTGIFGSFGENGVFQGTVSENTLSATWSFTDEDGNISEGEALFTISEDGTSFRGTYNDSTEPNLWLPWMGSKASSSTS